MISPEEAAGAVTALRICRYFPAEDLQRSQIAAMLIEMVGTKPELDWLVHQQSKLDWQGPFQLRQLFTTRFLPQDILTTEEAERAYFEAQSRETDRKLAEWKREQRLIGEPDPSPVETAEPVDTRTRTERELQQQHRDRRVQEYLERC